MNDRLTIDCGPKDEIGRRLVIATCGQLEHRDRIPTDNAFLRTRFAEAVLNKFGWPLTPEMLGEIDGKLLQLADVEDARQTRTAAVTAETVRLSEVVSREVEWLWPGRVALGKLTLLAGDPGLGKSYLTLDMASRVSRGAPWPNEESAATPDGRQPGSVILLSAEDDLTDTIRPRLDARGADCSKIVAIRAIAGKDSESRYRRAFDLARDLEHLEAELERMKDCRLVVVDPISAYLGRSAENVNAEVRSLLSPLAALAADRNVAVVVVTHLRKGEGTAMHRTMGSMAFVAAARAAWIVCRDPQTPNRRLMLPLKNNLATDVAGLAYSIEPKGPNGAAIVCWSNEAVTLQADEVFAQPSTGNARDGERREVCDWLRTFLAEGPQPAGEVRLAAEAHGFGYATLRRAFRDLNGKAIRTNDGMQVSWIWQLPAAAAVA
jgi:putative DNA primase/helicase